MVYLRRTIWYGMFEENYLVWNVCEYCNNLTLHICLLQPVETEHL